MIKPGHTRRLDAALDRKHRIARKLGEGGMASRMTWIGAMSDTGSPGRPAAALALLTVLVACSDGGTGPPESRVVASVDLDLLFAEPAPAEVEAIAAEWVARSPGAAEVAIEKDTVVTIGDPMRVRVVSHDVDGVRHYGAIIAGEGLVGSAPVVVYAHGGDAGASLSDVLQLAFLAGVATEFVWVVPSFRSESLRLFATTWTSEGPPSPWDHDVDDALSLLDVALQLEPAADEDRIGVLGFSRGGGVAMLIGIRDPRVDRVVEFFGPTDFFGTYVQDVTEEALLGSPRDLPGLAFLDERFIQPLRRGEITIAEVRAELIRRSAVLFAKRLPTLQVHHGDADDVVAVSQAESLIATMSALGRGAPDFEPYIYRGGTHNPLTLPGSIPRVVEFLSALLGAESGAGGQAYAEP